MTNGPLSEEALQAIEAQIPKLAEAAFARAELSALAAGGRVLKSSQGQLIEIDAEGTVRVLKDMPPGVQVHIGQKFLLTRGRS